MKLMSKMTVKEFRAHYDEYVKNFILNAKVFDLNFKEYMFMKGLPEKEFDKLILDK
jgi:hypothetical protein